MGHRTRSRSGALPHRAYGGEPSPAPARKQPPAAARKAREAASAAAAQQPHRRLKHPAPCKGATVGVSAPDPSSLCQA